MALPGILQQLDRLDKSSPQFPKEVAGLLYWERYEDCIPRLQLNEAAWLIEYLDNVCLYIALYPLSAQPV